MLFSPEVAELSGSAVLCAQVDTVEIRVADSACNLNMSGAFMLRTTSLVFVM